MEHLDLAYLIIFVIEHVDLYNAFPYEYCYFDTAYEVCLYEQEILDYMPEVTVKALKGIIERTIAYNQG